jgi:hypothetical protein
VHRVSLDFPRIA